MGKDHEVELEGLSPEPTDGNCSSGSGHFIPSYRELEGEEDELLQDAPSKDVPRVSTSRALTEGNGVGEVEFGMACYVASTFCMAMMTLFVKLAGRQGLPTWQIIFFRSAVVMAFSLPKLLAAGDNPFGNRKMLLAFRGLTGFGSNSALFFAVQVIPLADMSVFAFLTPMFVAIVSPLALKESVPSGTAPCCAACMLGVLLIAQPSFLFGNNRLTLNGVLLGLLHPVLSACAKTSIRLLCPTEKNDVMTFYLSLFTMGGSLIAMIAIPKQYRSFRTVHETMLILASGVFGYGTQAFMNMGLRRVKAASVLMMSYTGVIWSGIAGVLIFREYPNTMSAIGDLIILVSTLSFALWSSGLLRTPPKPKHVFEDVDEQSHLVTVTSDNRPLLPISSNATEVGRISNPQIRK